MSEATVVPEDLSGHVVHVGFQYDHRLPVLGVTGRPVLQDPHDDLHHVRQAVEIPVPRPEPAGR